MIWLQKPSTLAVLNSGWQCILMYLVKPVRLSIMCYYQQVFAVQGSVIEDKYIQGMARQSRAEQSVLG